MSEPLPPVFITSGGTSGTSSIPLQFEAPGPNLEILWTYNGDTPVLGTIWTSGQQVPYNAWTYENATEDSAYVYIQAIMHDTTDDSYSSIAVQDYMFLCANPIVVQSSTVNVSCPSPSSSIYYYEGTISEFDVLNVDATLVSNPDSISLPNGTYTFFSITLDGIVYSQSPVEIVVSSGASVLSPKIFIRGSGDSMQIYSIPVTPSSIVHYEIDNGDPNETSPTLDGFVNVSSGDSISIIAILGSDQSPITNKTIKSSIEYILAGMYPRNSSLKLSSSISNLAFGINSFNTVP